jgi:hypothetical protein
MNSTTVAIDLAKWASGIAVADAHWRSMNDNVKAATAQPGPGR